ncbi:MAG TPA: YicC/YloC family endoribonuclease [Pyrinomonadaceae bacterium]|nr:YicC/YloC family endoribonuclease [Pyrinomonadaceae bacterium]
MKSMTGFGRGAVTEENFAVSVEIKTVNNRFLDLNLRLANELQSLEANIKRLIQSRLSRGRIDVFINYERTSDVIYELNRPLISGYLSALKEMQNEFLLSGEPDLNLIARLPNALLTRADDLTENFTDGIETAVKLALEELENMREAEGESLKNELNSRLTEIEKQLPAVEAEMEMVADEYRQRLNKRIGILLEKSDAEIEIDQARLAQEVAYLADKQDISEEIIRLKSHIEQFRGILNEEKEVGKRLDFLTQEFNREANTIASKTNNLIVKEAALNIKSEIEKMREQVQNVE